MKNYSKFSKVIGKDGIPTKYIELGFSFPKNMVFWIKNERWFFWKSKSFHTITFFVDFDLPFRVFDKLKKEIEIFMIRISFYLKMKNETQIIDYFFHVEIDFYCEFLMISIFNAFNKRLKTRYKSYLIFMKELKNELLKPIKIDFMIIFISYFYALYKTSSS